MGSMTPWLITFIVAGCYFVGWFVTALAITQVGLPSRGCVKGCTFRIEARDPYYFEKPEMHGSHQYGCRKPHFELVDADDAAVMAIAWPYVMFHSLLVMSERNAKQREEHRVAAKRPVDVDALDAVLADERKMLPE